MKKILFLIFFFPIFLWSQSKIEILSSLDYSYRDFGNSGIVQSIRSSEIGKLNYHFDINYNQQLREKLWLKIGLGFSSMGYKTKNKEIIGRIDEQGNYDPYFSSGEFLQTKYDYHFLEIPIALRYEFLQNKIKPFIEIGITTNYYLQSTVRFFKNGDKIGSEKERREEINQIQFAPTLSFGLSYEINEKWELVAQPNFTYHVTKNYKESADLSLSNGLLKEHLWSAGISFGMRMNLK
ncbi:MAG: outer membrane beta-barrel protein [Saprospiraceae bacterium]